MIDDQRLDGEKKELHRPCADCGDGFTLTVGEQQFFETRGLVLPRRCKMCRAYRRQEREADGSSAALRVGR